MKTVLAQFIADIGKDGDATCKPDGQSTYINNGYRLVFQEIPYSGYKKNACHDIEWSECDDAFL
jgi:hypothetical protein